MRIRYHSQAREEMFDAASYYEAQADGLGVRFLDEIDKAVSDISRRPNSWPITKHRTRKRILVSPFPYSIHYLPRNNEVVIIAVAHQSRHTEYWLDRLD